LGNTEGGGGISDLYEVPMASLRGTRDDEYLSGTSHIPLLPFIEPSARRKQQILVVNEYNSSTRSPRAVPDGELRQRESTTTIAGRTINEPIAINSSKKVLRL